MLPALALMAEPPGWNHVLPLDAPGAPGLLADLVTAAGLVNAEFAVDLFEVAGAVEGGLVVTVGPAGAFEQKPTVLN